MDVAVDFSPGAPAYCRFHFVLILEVLDVLDFLELAFVPTLIIYLLLEEFCEADRFIGYHLDCTKLLAKEAAFV